MPSAPRADHAAFWGLMKDGKPIAPRSYSNGKSQQQVVGEILDAFKKGATDVFFHANLGSGKSIVALMVIANMGRGLVVVPTKNLQDQYQADYEGRLSVMNPRTGRPMKIRVVKGRDGFQCTYHGRSAASGDLVCTKEAPPNTPRYRIASECPDWSPLYSREMVDQLQEKVFLGDEVARDVEFQGDLDAGVDYEGIFGPFSFVPRGKVCPYFAQYDHFLRADAIILNQAKWMAETNLGRKPRLDVEIFDECDHLLDTLVDSVTITAFQLEKLQRQFTQPRAYLTEGKRDALTLKEKKMVAFLQEARKELATEPEKEEEVPVPVNLLETLITIYNGMEENDEAAKIAGQLKRVLEYQDVSLCIRKNSAYYFTIGEPKRILGDLLARSGRKRLWMSATLQDPAILREVYGFMRPVIVQGETAYQGDLKLCLPEPEIEQEVGAVEMNFERWYGRNGHEAGMQATRDQFMRNLAWIRKHVEGPTAYLIHGKAYLESIEKESKDARAVLKLLTEEREDDDTLQKFIRGEVREIASTRMNRGVDLKGDLCRDIVIFKFPIPDVSDPRFRAIHKNFVEKFGPDIGDGMFWKYAKDCARRTLLQQIGRGLRAPDDWVRVWSTDAKVIKYLLKEFPDKKVVQVVRYGLTKRRASASKQAVDEKDSNVSAQRAQSESQGVTLRT
ncbi:MAG TPA: helicase C-terminal domain-containing protein [Candidatus Thermoplasmatota archaeon]|nr:helicase C-terminal domain-containing protein [Candidatus Thermoplasmatota archaeon]